MTSKNSSALSALAALSHAPIVYDGRQSLSPFATLISKGLAAEQVNDKGLPVFSITEKGRTFVSGSKR